MSDRDARNAELLADVATFLATPRTPPSANPPGQIKPEVFPSIGLPALREHCGCPDNLLATAMQRLWEAREQQGPLHRPAVEDALDLIALARFWMKSEAWRPMPLEIRKATTFARATSKQPSRLFDLRWWRGDRT